MTPRKRSKTKAGWPKYLYERNGYFSWRHPQTNMEYGIGYDKAEAFREAIEANLHLAGHLRKERLIDRIEGTAGRTVAQWAAKYAEILQGRKLSPASLKTYGSFSRRMVEMLGADTKVRAVTALQVSEGLEVLTKSGRESLARSVRGFMRESFAAAIVKGWLDTNPVREIKGTPVTVKRARLTFDIFQRLYASTDCTWLKNAMALALVSGQARAEIVAAQVKDVREGCWWVERGKTEARICLPLELRLERFGASLGDVIRQCRSTGILSPYLIHQTLRAGRALPGKRIRRDHLSIRFTEALAALNLDFGEKRPPTFHEIRSLAARLYKKQGNVNVQELLGHKNPQTTLLYEDGRGEWIRVKVGTV